MKKTFKNDLELVLILLVIAFFATFLWVKHAELTKKVPSIVSDTIVEPVSKQEVIKEDYSDKKYIAKLVNEYADYYGVSRRTMHLVVANESGYNYKAYTQHDGGHNWSAYGLVQINMRFWGDKITPEMARDPHYALDFLAREIKDGNGSQWTAYRVCVQGKQVYYQGKKLTCDTSKVITV